MSMIAHIYMSWINQHSALNIYIRIYIYVMLCIVLLTENNEMWNFISFIITHDLLATVVF